MADQPLFEARGAGDGRAGSPPGREFVAEITKCQRRLYGFIRTLVYDHAAIEEVLQDTNLALWEQAERFQPGTDFMAWACRVAWFKVLEHRRARKRQRLSFSMELMETIADEAIEDTESLERRERALLECVDALSERHREVLKMHYFAKMPFDQIGARIDRKANAVAQLMFRIRNALRECIERRVTEAPA